ncbi:MAG: hypothetical protein C4341_05780 [Armatimonadota bacterium]
MSVNAYQVPKEDPRAPVELVCENRYVRATLSTCDGGSIHFARKGDGGPAVALAAPLSARGRAVLSAVHEGADEARAFFGGVYGDSGVTWEAQVRLRSASASLFLSWKLFNRRIALSEAVPMSLRFPAPTRALAGGICCILDGSAIVVASDERVAGVHVRDDRVLIEARAPALLPPLRTRVVSCALHLVSVPGDPVAANERFVVLRNADEGKLRVHAAEETPSAKVFLQLESGETVEAPLSAYPERAAEYALRGLRAQPNRILIRGEGGETLMDAPMRGRDLDGIRATVPVEWEQWDELPLARGMCLLAEGRQAEAEKLLLAATHAPGLEHAAWFALGLSAMRSERWLLAGADFEESLLYCGSNPLAWWLKNWSLRRAGVEDENDLPNAHFLAPLDPCLRAEAFLSGGGEKVLEEFGTDPVPFLEVADVLWWGGQEPERQAVLAAGAEQTHDALLHRLRAIGLRRKGLELEAAEEQRKVEAAQSSEEPRRVSELIELEIP